MSGKRAAAAAPWLTLERRGWLYRVMTALALLLAGYGIVSETDLPLWLGLAGAVLGTGTASVYSPTRKAPGDPNE